MVTFIVAAIIGVGVGIMSGLLGVGGGMIMVPVFRLALGLPPVVSTGTSLFTIIPTSISGAATHIRKKTCILGLGIAMGIGGACTSPLGVWLAQIAPGWVIMAAAAAVLAYSGYTTLRKALKAPKRNQAQKEDSGNPAASSAASAVATSTTNDASAPQIPSTPPTIAKAILIGIIAGVASGFVGVGGGFIMVPLMTMLFDMPMKLTSGTSLVAVVILAIPGAITQCFFGNVDYLISIAVACGSIPGAYLGARLVSRISERGLRFAFAAFLGIAAILLLVKETGVLA